MQALPTQYQWIDDLINKALAPRMIVEGRKLYGTKEIPGPRHNPVILQWADAIGIGSLVNDDEQAWCGLAMGYVAVKAGKYLNLTGWDILRAKSWKLFGKAAAVAMFGDVLIFDREGGGHVGMYIGEDETHYHVMAGNQGNEYNIRRMPKGRLSKGGIRRPIYATGQPKSVQVIRLAPTGIISTTES